MSISIGITGMGLVSSLGVGVERNFEQLLAGACGVRPLTRFPTEGLAHPNGGQLEADDEDRLRTSCVEDDIAYAMIGAAASEALGPAHGETPDAELGLVLGTNFGIMETLEWCWRERLETGEMDLDTFRCQQDVVERVAQHLGAAGPRAQLSLSCASGAGAVALACEWLRAGRTQRVVAICYDALSEFCWCGLSNLRTMSTAQRLRPFDRRRDGTIFGEGAAAILLSTRPEDAELAQVCVAGAATNNNAFHLTAPCRDGEGSRRVMAAALADAKLPAPSIDLISAHATATTANDVTESAAINALMPGKAPVAAFKGNFGHMMGAGGLAEIIMTVKAMQQGQTPPIRGLEEQDPACELDCVRGGARQTEARVALTNSAGIGGNNAAVVLCRGAGNEAAAKDARPVFLRRIGWVLPGLVGSGDQLPDCGPEALAAAREELARFSVKPYLKSVKGYLDPAAAYCLGAAAQCLGDAAAVAAPERFAVVAATQYGAATSGYRFYGQLLAKGPRFASPLIFPHSYPNTAANLVAIEFGLAGPHLVLNNCPDPTEAWWSTLNCLRRSQADDALLLCCEGVPPELLPDGQEALVGALCFWFTAHAPDGSSAPPTAPAAAPGNRRGVLWPVLERGSRADDG